MFNSIPYSNISKLVPDEYQGLITGVLNIFVIIGQIISQITISLLERNIRILSIYAFLNFVFIFMF